MFLACQKNGRFRAKIFFIDWLIDLNFGYVDQHDMRDIPWKFEPNPSKKKILTQPLQPFNPYISAIYGRILIIFSPLDSWKGQVYFIYYRLEQSINQ